MISGDGWFTLQQLDEAINKMEAEEYLEVLVWTSTNHLYVADRGHKK